MALGAHKRRIHKLHQLQAFDAPVRESHEDHTQWETPGPAAGPEGLGWARRRWGVCGARGQLQGTWQRGRDGGRPHAAATTPALLKNRTP